MRASTVAMIALTAGVLGVASARLADAAVTGAEASHAAPTKTAQIKAHAHVSGATSITKAADGHFWAEAKVDGVRVRFLVDTGASVVALTPTDAQRVGVAMDDLVFDQPVNTAAGRVMAAGLTLGEVSVGGIAKQQIQALVVNEGLTHSLLGMSYLGELSRIEATRETLILRR